jgi:hypothetical protein
MQTSFDLFTRPVLALSKLIETTEETKTLPMLHDLSHATTNFQLLKLAFYVSEHRLVHGKYVLKSIYQTTPEGGQSRSQGTGGSTPEFLKQFLDQTHASIQPRIDALNTKEQQARLTPVEREEFTLIKQKLIEAEAIMGLVRQKGLDLAASGN